MTNNDPPHTFRAAEIRQIFACLEAGESCQVIGANGSGKTSLMQTLVQSNAAQQYLGTDCERYLLVYLNSHLLLERSDWGLYELMLHKLVKYMETRGAPERILHTADELHQRATEKNTMHLALRYLDRALSLTTQMGCDVVVFLFDEFDQLARELSPACFSALRGIRDEHKYRLMYVISADRLFSELREDSYEIEGFNELVLGHQIWLTTFCQDDARKMIQQVAERGGISLSPEQIERIMTFSGCHPGLIRAMVSSVRLGYALEEAGLVRYPLVKEECRQIWRSLAVTEQRALLQFISNQQPQEDVVTWQRLKDKGILIDQGANARVIFSPMFAHFLANEHPVAGAMIEIDHKRREVWVQNRRIANLTPQEFSCLDYMDQHRGEVCRPEAIARYNASANQSAQQAEAMEEGDDLYKAAIDAMIKRLRKKIEPDPANPRFIINVRGLGYKLVDGG